MMVKRPTWDGSRPKHGTTHGTGADPLPPTLGGGGGKPSPANPDGSSDAGSHRRDENTDTDVDQVTNHPSPRDVAGGLDAATGDDHGQGRAQRSELRSLDVLRPFLAEAIALSDAPRACRNVAGATMRAAPDLWAEVDRLMSGGWTPTQVALALVSWPQGTIRSATSVVWRKLEGLPDTPDRDDPADRDPNRIRPLVSRPPPPSLTGRSTSPATTRPTPSRQRRVGRPSPAALVCRSPRSSTPAQRRERSARTS